MIAIDTSPKAEDLEERALEDLRFGCFLFGGNL